MTDKFNQEQLKRIIDAANKHRVMREGLAEKIGHTYSGLNEREAVSLCLQCMDDLENAHEHLQAHLDEFDCHELWVATGEVV